jgi:hypothetical protein
VSLYHHNLKKNQAKKLFFRLDNNDKFKTAEMEKRWLPFVVAVGSCVQNHFYKRPSSRLNLLKHCYAAIGFGGQGIDLKLF